MRRYKRNPNKLRGTRREMSQRIPLLRHLGSRNAVVGDVLLLRRRQVQTWKRRAPRVKLVLELLSPSHNPRANGLDVNRHLQVRKSQRRLKLVQRSRQDLLRPRANHPQQPHAGVVKHSRKESRSRSQKLSTPSLKKLAKSQSQRSMHIPRQKPDLRVLGAAGRTRAKARTNELQNPRRHLQRSKQTLKHHKSPDGRQENPGAILCLSPFIVLLMLLLWERCMLQLKDLATTTMTRPTDCYLV
jgi:hypothetical protein